MTKQDLVKLLKREFTNEDGNIDISELDFGKFEGFIHLGRIKSRGNVFQGHHCNEGNVFQGHHSNRGDVLQSYHSNKGYVLQCYHSNKGDVYQDDHSNEGEVDKALHIGSVMPRFILMGVEFNDIWKLPDFYVCEDEGTLHTANDDIEEATDFDYDNAIEAKNWLQEKYNDYTWYMVALNGA